MKEYNVTVVVAMIIAISVKKRKIVPIIDYKSIKIWKYKIKKDLILSISRL